MRRNTIYHGDCMEVVRGWPDESVDLIYLDPPFNSGADYGISNNNAGDSGGGSGNKKPLAFTDTWQWDQAAARRIQRIKTAKNHRAKKSIAALEKFYQPGAGMLAYLAYMAERIHHMHCLLKDSGGIYLHCDPAASHYLKMIMDDVFGAKNFQNEIIWSYRTGGASKRRFARKHDIIFFYTKSASYTFHPQKEKAYTKSDGRKAGVVNYGGGEAEFFEDHGGVYNWVNMRDVWDIPYIGSTHKERLGYPTQKPLALLRRIIKASSREGELVLDPFCGSGAAIEAAIDLRRDFIGIDISMRALDMIQTRRLRDMRLDITAAAQQ